MIRSRPRQFALLANAILLTLLASFYSAAEIPPTVPVGFDAYRQWEKWPQQRLGVRAYMRSTYDRSGGNEGADASHFLFQLSATNNVTLDITGLGTLYFARYNHWHGSPWHYAPTGGGALQSSPSLSPSAIWSNVAVGGTFIDPVNGNKFYRVAR